MKSQIIRLSLLLVLLGQLLLGAVGASAQKSGGIESGDGTVGGPVGLNSHTYSYKLGHRYSYDWQTTVETVGSVHDADGSSENEDSFNITASVEVIPVQQLSAGTFIHQLKVLNPHSLITVVDETGALVTEETISRELQTALSMPFYYAQTPQGGIEYILFANDDLEASQNIKRGIVDSLQLQLQAQRLTSERSPNGTAMTHYEQAAVGRSITIKKTRNAADYIRFADPTVGTTPMVIDENLNAEYDPTIGTIRSVNYSSFLATPSETETDPNAPVERAIHSSIATTGNLHLTSVSSAPVTELLPPISPRATLTGIKQSIERTWNTTYTQGDLVAIYSLSLPTVNPDFTLRAGLAALVADPEAYAPVSDLIDLFMAQPETLRELRTMVDNAQIDQGVYPNLAAVLGHVGSVDAQAVLFDTMINNTALPIDVRLEALNALVGVAHPSAATLAHLQTYAQNSTSELFPQSTALLGTFAFRLAADEPQQAQAIVNAIVAKLATTSDEALIEVYLNALGNAGDPTTASIIEGYLNHQSSFIRIAAVDALRKIPTEQTVELLLKARADTNPAVAHSADMILADMVAQTQAPQAMDASPLWNWSKKIGSGDIYANLAAKIEASKVNGQLKLYAAGWVDAHLWKIHKNNVVKAEAYSDVYQQNSQTKRRFGVNVFIMGEKLYSTHYEMVCGDTKGAYIVNKTFTFFNLPYSFWVYGIKVKFSVKVGGKVAVYWSYGYNACTPTNSSAFVSIEPSTSLVAEASASVDIGLFKAGINVEGKFLNTKIPTKLTASLQGTQLKGCLNMTLEFNAASLRIYGWYKWWRLFKGKWGYKEKTFWNKSFGSYTQPLFNNCISN